MAQMTNIADILAIIPARGGSKGLPGKNIMDLCGKPVIAWSIDSCLQAPCIGSVIVSSDDHLILKAASDYGADTLLRPKELATDSSAMIPVVKHVLGELKEQFSRFKFLALVQPTSPLRSWKHLQDAYDMLIRKEADSVISVFESDRSILKSFVLENGVLKGVNNNQYPFSRRQDLPAVYKPNGAIYIIEIEKFMHLGALLTSKTIPYIMNEEDSLDIDNLEDFKCVQNILKKRANRHHF